MKFRRGSVLNFAFPIPTSAHRLRFFGRLKTEAISQNTDWTSISSILSEGF